MEVNLTRIIASLKQYLVELFKLSLQTRLLASGLYFQTLQDFRVPQQIFCHVKLWFLTFKSIDSKIFEILLTPQSLPTNSNTDLEEGPLCNPKSKSTFASVNEASARAVTSGGET
ncbi:sequence-specific DNA binding transcription factors [Striga asiatica]|uniref:Sequence-specific DNA binding transcription factors n=1 Tax=Striga asiatica TaxID=4170 RepID=A0A5A7R8X8_STRAF|nr:sequence-specific DNA binding transcription factors [Striga asiatica]